MKGQPRLLTKRKQFSTEFLALKKTMLTDHDVASVVSVHVAAQQPLLENWNESTH
jgi:hypothetical protein